MRAIVMKGEKAWWCVPLVLVLPRQRQEDCDIKASLNITARHFLSMTAIKMMVKTASWCLPAVWLWSLERLDPRCLMRFLSIPWMPGTH